jgi:hypothetical protein
MPMSRPFTTPSHLFSNAVLDACARAARSDSEPTLAAPRLVPRRRFAARPDPLRDFCFFARAVIDVPPDTRREGSGEKA